MNAKKYVVFFFPFSKESELLFCVCRIVLWFSSGNHLVLSLESFYWHFKWKHFTICFVKHLLIFHFYWNAAGWQRPFPSNSSDHSIWISSKECYKLEKFKCKIVVFSLILSFIFMFVWWAVLFWNSLTKCNYDLNCWPNGWFHWKKRALLHIFCFKKKKTRNTQQWQSFELFPISLFAQKFRRSNALNRKGTYCWSFLSSNFIIAHPSWGKPTNHIIPELLCFHIKIIIHFRL